MSSTFEQCLTKHVTMLWLVISAHREPHRSQRNAQLKFWIKKCSLEQVCMLMLLTDKPRLPADEKWRNPINLRNVNAKSCCHRWVLSSNAKRLVQRLVQVSYTKGDTWWIRAYDKHSHIGPKTCSPQQLRIASLDSRMHLSPFHLPVVLDQDTAGCISTNQTSGQTNACT